MRRRLRRDIRLLKAYAAISTLAITVLTGLGLAQVPPARQRFQKIDVERINVIERDGRVRLVLSNAERQADAVIDGRTIAPGRRRPAGMIFFNEVGDEVGGLIFSGQTQNGTPQASGSLWWVAAGSGSDATIGRMFSEDPCARNLTSLTLRAKSRCGS